MAAKYYFSDGIHDGIREFLKDPYPTELFVDHGEMNGSRYDHPSGEILDKMSASSLNSFMLLNENGTFEFISESDIIKKEYFNRLREAYLKGRIIQKLGSPSDGFGVPKRFPENLHPGKTISESYIEQLVGRINKKDLPKKLQQFAGYVTSKLYRINPQTGKKSEPQGYIFDVFQVDLKEEKDSIRLFVKRYLSVDGKKDDIIVTRLDTTYPYYYFIFDQMPVTKGGDIFLMTRLEGLNISYPYPIAYSLFVVDKDLKYEVNSKPDDSFIKKFDRRLRIVGLTLQDLNNSQAK